MILFHYVVQVFALPPSYPLKVTSVIYPDCLFIGPLLSMLIILVLSHLPFLGEIIRIAPKLDSLKSRFYAIAIVDFLFKKRCFSTDATEPRLLLYNMEGYSRFALERY